MKFNAKVTLIFAILFAVFFLGLIFLRIPFPIYPLMSVQDVFDLLTPLVLIPMYWLLLKNKIGDTAGRGVQIGFVLIASLWVLGHGMHLAANSINNLAEALAKQGAVNILGTDIYTLAYFYDEVLSHYLWHTGIIAMAALIAYNDYRHPYKEKTNWGITGLAGVIYGFSAFCVHNEGQTALLGLTFSILISCLVIFFARIRLKNQPILAFIFVSYTVALLLFVVWYSLWGYFPEFTEVGWI